MLKYKQNVNNGPVVFTWRLKKDEMSGGIML